MSDKLNDDVYVFITVITNEDGSEDVETHTADGLYSYHDGPASIKDLINIPEKREMWVNVYESGGLVPHDSKEAADMSAIGNRIACIRVEYEVGEGL